MLDPRVGINARISTRTPKCYKAQKRLVRPMLSEALGKENTPTKRAQIYIALNRALAGYAVEIPCDALKPIWTNLVSDWSQGRKDALGDRVIHCHWFYLHRLKPLINQRFSFISIIFLFLFYNLLLLYSKFFLYVYQIRELDYF